MWIIIKEIMQLNHFRTRRSHYISQTKAMRRKEKNKNGPIIPTSISTLKQRNHYPRERSKCRKAIDMNSLKETKNMIGKRKSNKR